MENKISIDNQVFMSAFASAILMVVTIIAAIASARYAQHNLYYFMLFPLVTGATSAMMLGYAIRHDRDRANK